MAEFSFADFFSHALHAVVVAAVACAFLPLVSWLEALRGDETSHAAGRAHSASAALATAIKLLEKRAPRVAGSDRIVSRLAPILALVPTLMVLGLMPMQSRPSDVPLVLCLSLFLLSTTAVALAGMASANRLVLLAAVRLFSIRVVVISVVGTAALAIVRDAGSSSLSGIVSAQQGSLWDVLPRWGMFVSPLSFLAALISWAFYAQQTIRARTEASLAPTWIAESTGPGLLGHRIFESLDLVAGAALLVCVFAGGEHAPIAPALAWILKTGLMLVLLVLVRNRLPHLAPASVVRVLWLVLFPLAVAGTAWVLISQHAI